MNRNASFSAEDLLARNTEQLHFAMNAAGIGVWEADLAHNKLLCDDRCCALLGLQQQNVMRFDEALLFVHPDDRPAMQSAIESALRGDNEGLFDITYRTIGADGIERWINATGTAYPGEAGKPTRFGGVARDVTDNYLARQKANAARQQVFDLLHESSVGIAAVSRDNLKFTSANPFYGALVGRPPEYLIGRPLFEALPEAKGRGFEAQLYGVMDTGTPFMAKETGIEMMRNGRLEMIYVNYVFHPVHDDNGRNDSVLIVATDVTPQVTARKEAVEARQKLEATEAYRRLLSNTVPAMIFYLDAEQRYQSYNEKVMEWYNVGADEIIGKTVLQFLGEEAYTRIAPHLSIAYGGVQEQYEMRAPSRMDGKKWLRIVYTPHKNETGAVIGVIGHATDITDSKQNELALQESEIRFRSLVEEAPIAIALFTGPEMKVEVANSAILRYWHKDASIIGKPISEVLPELNGQPFPNILKNAFATGETYKAHAAFVQLMVDGVLTDYYFDFTYKPLLNAEGQVYGILDMAVDVTEETLAVQRIEEGRQQLLSSFNDMPVGLALVEGHDLVFRMANPFYGVLAGRPPEALIGKPLLEAMPELKGQGFDDELRKVMATGQPFTAREAPVQIYHGGELKTIYIDHTYQPQREATGNANGVFIVVIEVSEQRAAKQKIEAEVELRTQELADANQALQASNKELHRSNHHLEEFAHAASHDLKEPIRKIHFFTTRLKEQLSDKLSPEQAHTFSRISNATERMATLIDDLLVYSHVSQRPHAREAVDLTEKLNRVLEDLELDIQEKGASITTAPLPLVQGYGRQLQQLFQNLVSNAIKYSKEGVRPELEITAAQVQENGRPYHVIAVKDNGIGFEEEYSEKIFQMFMRLHGKTEYSGTGVGLSIVKKIVENHNGLIRVESRKDVGSTFSIYLPIV